MIIATDRARRPTDFARERVIPVGGRFCPFCPGNEAKTPPEVLAYRTSGAPNEPGWSVRVVPNKFPALRIEGDLDRQAEGLYDHMNGIGAHEVIISTPDHMAEIGSLADTQLADTYFAIRDRILDLRRDIRLRYILVFRNHGELAGASLEHPHLQLIALPVVPKRVQEEIDGSLRYFQFRERCIYCDIVGQELQSQKRIVVETDQFVAVTPYASRFPFEVWVLPRKHDSHYERLDAQATHNLGVVMHTVFAKLSKALEMPPFNAILHTAPVQEGPMAHYHWHIEIMPKLTKVAGFEWGSGFYINPTPPEEAARFLREVEI